MKEEFSVLRRIGLILHLCALSNCLFSQEIRHLDYYKNISCFNCDSSNVGQDIFESYELNSQPLSNIYQLSVKINGGIKHYATISFISENCLITNRHCVEYLDKIDFIEVRISNIENKWLTLNKSDFEVLYYGETFSSFDYDLAIIKIKNTNKLKKIFRSSFRLIDKSLPDECKVVHVTGYPFKKFVINSKAPDTLVSRSIKYEQIEFNKSRTMIGYPLCTCPGDSGAPIWFEYKNKFYIIGIHQGSRSGEKGFINRQLNVGIFFNDEVTDWILSKVKL